MRVYRLHVTEEYEWIVTRDLAGDKALVAASGVAQGAAWEPVPVDLLTTDDQGRPELRADCPWLGRHLLITRPRAKEVTMPLLADFGEFLSLICDDDDLAAFNCLNVVDALDEDSSKIAYTRRGRIITIEEYGFRERMLPERTAFRVPQYLETIFFTEPLVQDLRDLGLAGLRLDAVATVEAAA